MSNSPPQVIDTSALVIGSGLAGLVVALKMAEQTDVLICTKATLSQTNSAMAQGGIAAVMAEDDSFSKHIQDTLTAGAGLCREDIVRQVVELGPARIQDLMKWGVRFDFEGDHVALTREGGHSARRILHIADHTGQEIHSQLLKLVLQHPRIRILENHYALDLILNQHIYPHSVEAKRCEGAYVLNKESGEMLAILAQATFLATGGAGRIYLYTSNWSGATGDGLALAARAGARVANLEFMQFHPTCLYHSEARNFLISEALRGEGGELLNAKGEAFMERYHKSKSLAPRDIVARSIDAEMKRSGAECVYLDMTHHSEEFLQKRFPVIFAQCLKLNLNIAQSPIPVVPAAHYLCGGVLTNLRGQTDIAGLFALGETACTGLHGANRLASNSLLECLVVSDLASQSFLRSLKKGGAGSEHTDDKLPREARARLTAEKAGQLFSHAPIWSKLQLGDADEMNVIYHMWDEIRRLMWNYVGIVRTHKRLKRAQDRLKNIRSEIFEYYSNYKIHAEIEELRNLALVADLTVQCALKRKESRGIHYNLDCPDLLDSAEDTIVG